MSVWICNGLPKSGKTTFENYVRELYDGPCIIISTIDTVKAIAIELGWNGEKTPQDRKFLSDLKRLLTEWQDIPFQKALQEIRRAQLYFKEDPLIFVDSREPEEIKRFVDTVGAKTLYVSRPGLSAKHQSNDSDANVEDWVYDVVIYNDLGLDGLRNRAKNFIKMIERGRH